MYTLANFDSALWNMREVCRSVYLIPVAAKIQVTDLDTC